VNQDIPKGTMLEQLPNHGFGKIVSALLYPDPETIETGSINFSNHNFSSLFFLY